MGKNKHINEIFENIRIIPVSGRGQSDTIFGAYSAAVQDLGHSEAEIFGLKEMPDVATKKGRK
jgi:hypothetical protein